MILLKKSRRTNVISVEERLELIRNSKSLREVQNAGVMPEPDSGEGYYFISYSHKDYKQVFESILGLQNENIKYGTTADWRQEKAGLKTFANVYIPITARESFFISAEIFCNPRPYGTKSILFFGIKRVIYASTLSAQTVFQRDLMPYRTIGQKTCCTK